MRQQRWLGPAMFIPAILYIVILVGVPFVMAFVYSVGDVKVGSEGYHFVGLHNFASVLKSPTFLLAVRNSFIFTISSQILVLIGATVPVLTSPTLTQRIPATTPKDFGSPQSIGGILFQSYLLPFEITGLLLLVATIGILMLAKRRIK